MFYEHTNNGIILRVRLKPNSSCCKIFGIFIAPNGEEFLKIDIISIPEKGKANQELISLLSKKLHLAKSNFTIISGTLDRYKKILITGEVEDIENKLQ